MLTEFWLWKCILVTVFLLGFCILFTLKASIFFSSVAFAKDKLLDTGNRQSEETLPESYETRGS